MKKILGFIGMMLAGLILTGGLAIGQEKMEKTVKVTVKDGKAVTITTTKIDGKETIVIDSAMTIPGHGNMSVLKMDKSAKGHGVICITSTEKAADCCAGADSAALAKCCPGGDTLKLAAICTDAKVVEGFPIGEGFSFTPSEPTDENGITLKSLGDGMFRLNYRSDLLKPIKIEVFDGEGNRLFSQKVKNFLGKYVKDIYLMENDPGFYSIRVKQADREEIGEFQFK